MMLRGQKALLVVGTLAIALLAWILMFTASMPGGLASPHAKLAELSSQGSCQRCHTGADLAAGCLSCHSEIQAQLAEKKGYHAYLLKEGAVHCTDCHEEHTGEESFLITERSWGAQVPRAFKHPHVEYGLEGAHTLLPCEDCHQKELKEKLTLPGFASTPRLTTFLGLEQGCRACHEDRHTGGLTPICSTCHGQEVFKPPIKFDHGLHFPLIGGHTGLACGSCHVLPERAAAPRPFPFPFEETRGKACEECHKKPHHAAALERCEDCHLPAAPHWPDAIGNVTPEKHAVAGFRLLGAHAGIDCAKCHPQEEAFPERYRDPSGADYQRFEDTCQGCHRDVHQGQFVERHGQCLDCHDRHRFQPSTYGQEAHGQRYSLTGAHLGVSCIGCHRTDTADGPRHFAGTSHVCKDCHTYPHGEQFRREIADGDCTMCHSGQADTFLVRPFDHQGRTGYPLLGAHAKALCNECHVELPEASGERVRKYRGTDQECGNCHRDVHRGQFLADGGTTCSACHRSFDSWQTLVFNHDTMSRFRLEGAHALAACGRCHLPVKLPDGSDLIQYKPLGVDCTDCHDIVPGSPTNAVR